MDMKNGRNKCELRDEEVYDISLYNYVSHNLAQFLYVAPGKHHIMREDHAYLVRLQRAVVRLCGCAAGEP